MIDRDGSYEIVPICKKTSSLPLSLSTELNAYRRAHTTTTANVTAGSPVAFDRSTPT